MKIPLDKLVTEVQSGLSTEAKGRMRRAKRAMDFYSYDGLSHMGEFMRTDETALDFALRPYRESGLTREVVDVLTQHLYAPGPSRTWSDPAGQEFLERVYSDNHIDALMLRADQLATIGDAAAIQVDVDAGDFAGRPITLRLWGADEFHVWEDPDNRNRPGAVVTKDMYDETTRYRLWTEDVVVTFETGKANSTSGGRVADEVRRDDNTYGCLPFAFTHYEYPIQAFWQSGIGDFVASAEIRFNDRLSRLDESIGKHMNPILFGKNLPDGAQLEIGRQRLVRLTSRAGNVDPVSGGYMPSPPPELGYSQVIIDIAGAWEDLRGFVVQILEAVGVPQSAVRMEQSGVASGIALVIEQAPLLTRARRRRGAFSVYETDLARTILRCAGSHYHDFPGMAKLIGSAQAGVLSLGWPTPSVPVPTQDWFDLEVSKVEKGVKSVVMVVQEMYGVPREQAINLLRQIKEDGDVLAKIMPETSESGRPEPDEGDDSAGTEAERPGEAPEADDRPPAPEKDEP